MMSFDNVNKLKNDNIIWCMWMLFKQNINRLRLLALNQIPIVNTCQSSYLVIALEITVNHSFISFFKDLKWFQSPNQLGYKNKIKIIIFDNSFYIIVY